jgi:hypothetical protein
MEGKGLTAEVDGEVLAALELDDEVVLAFVELRDGDDGVQKIAVNLQVRSSVLMVSCNGDGARLDVSVPTVVSRAWRGAAWAEGS